MSARAPERSAFEALRAAVAGRAPRSEGRAAVYRMLAATDGRTAAGRPRARASADAEFDLAFAEALESLPSRLAAAEERRSLAVERAERVSELLLVSQARAREYAAALEPEQLAPLLAELVDRADELAVAAPAAGIALARFVAEAAELGLSSSEDPAADDLRARVRRCLAEAEFRGGDLVAAESSLGQAARMARRGTGDPVLRAEILRVAAEVRSDQSRFAEARRLAERAVSLLARAGESRREGRARVTLAMKLFLDGRTAEALAENDRALALVDGERDSRWRLAAEFNRAFWSYEIGDERSTKRALPRLRRLALAKGSAHDRICLDWLEARIVAREGDLEGAAELYRPVLARCLELDTIYDSAAVALELAVVLLELGRAEEVLPLADTVAPIFRAQGVEPEAAAAVLLAAESLRRGVAAREVLRTLIAARASARGTR